MLAIEPLLSFFFGLVLGKGLILFDFGGWLDWIFKNIDI
jgi:hypothetical protein